MIGKDETSDTRIQKVVAHYKLKQACFLIKKKKKKKKIAIEQF